MSHVVTQHQPSENNTRIHRNNEIDLLELIAGLWRGRWIITGVIIICISVAIIWLKISPDIYSVKATIQPPTKHQLTLLQPSVLKKGVGNTAATYQLDHLVTEDTQSVILGIFNSLSIKKTFWEKKNKRTVDLKNLDSETFQAFTLFSNTLKVATPTSKSKNAGPLMINLTLETKKPIEGVLELQAFVDFAATAIRQKLAARVSKGIKGRLQALRADITLYRQREVIRTADKLTQLREALHLAKSLNINDMPYDQSNGAEPQIMDSRLYLLGSKTLQAEVNTLEARKNIAAFVPELRDMALWKQQMEADLLRLTALDDSAEVFQLTRSPEATLAPINPKLGIVLSLAVIVGGMLGALVLLIRHGMASYQARKG